MTQNVSVHNKVEMHQYQIGMNSSETDE